MCIRDRYRERTARSGEYFERASGVMPGGVPSQFQKNDPWPVYIERGTGAQVWDVDGNEYLDFHNGFGVMCVGHANPVIAATTIEPSVGAAKCVPRSIRALTAAPPATTSSSRSRAPTTATTTP